MKRRILSIITALALCLSLCPTWALAAEADPSLCKHHPEHTEDCGYAAPTEGHDCGHEHTAECYTLGVLPDADSGNPYEVGGDTENLLDCQHSHDSECGYVQADPGAPCGYVCRICPIEALIAALPEQVTEDNADGVRGQLDHILDLFTALNEDEQDQIDLSRIYALQGALDNANAPMMVAGEINISQTGDNILTAEDGDCPGHTFTGTAQAARIYVESGTHDVTFSNLNITNGAQVGIAPGAAMNLTIDETNTIQASNNLAGIYVPVGATLIINGTGSLNVSGNNSAGIGGATYALDESGSDGDPNCGTVEINGGTVTATGGSTAAGIGGGIDTEGNPGNGGKVTINGGTVTATGGSDSYYGGAGIGGSAGETASDPAGNGGTLTINGGTVNLTAGTHEPQYPAYGFGQGSGSAPGGTCELTLADASYLAEGTTLDPNGKYTINGDPTADMIVVPELVYTGEVLDTSGIKIDDSKTGTGTYFGQTFTVNASADGWTYAINPSEVKAAGDYTVTFSKEGHTSISKTFTVAKSGTQFVGDGEVKTYNGSEETTSFSAGDTITVKATPTATGDAPQKAAARLQGGPGTGQMALYVGDALVSSEAADADADGSYTMTVSASDVLTLGGVEPNGDPITLTAKFVGNDNMADGAGTVEVNITAAAKAERDGTLLGYYDESGLDAALLDKNNEGAVFTLLDNMETELKIRISCTLDLNGKTVHSKGEDDPTLSIYNGTTVTIRGEGTVLSEQGRGFYVGGTATLEGGTFISSGEGYSGVYVRGKLIVTGENVVMRNTGNGNGLSVDSGNEATAQLSAGTYEGGAAAIEIYQGTGTLAGLLNQEGASRVAYYKDNTTLVTEGLDGKTLPSGSYTVKACSHIFGSSTTCPACGGEAVARVTIGGAVTHYGDLPSAWAAVQGQTADLYLLKSVDAAGVGRWGRLDLASGSVTLGMADGVVLSGSSNVVIRLTGGELTLNSGTIRNNGTTGNPPGLQVVGGTLRISGGTVEANWAVYINGGHAEITGGTFTATGNYSVGLRKDEGTVKISGGQFSGSLYAVYNSNGTLADLLAEDYAFKQGGAWVTDTSGDSLTGTVTAEPAPVKITAQPVNTSQRYGDMDALSIETSPGQDESVTYQWYVVKASGAEAVSGEIAPVFSPSENQRLDVGSYQYFCEVTKDGYTQRSNTVTFTVTLRQVNPSITGTASKTYDGTTGVASGQLSITLTGVVTGDTVTASATSYAYDNANAGENKTITASGITLEGDSKDNYTLSSTTATTTGTITKATVSITWGNTTQTVTYSGTQATITVPTVSAENGVTVNVTPEYSYAAQDGATFTQGLPTSAGTYTVRASTVESSNLTAAQADMTLTINKASLSIDSAAVASKPYDGTDTATVSGVTFTGLVNGETLALDTDYTATGTFADANAGEGKSVTVTVTLADTAKANNYQLSDSTCTATADITKASSSITKAPTASGITYGQALSDSNLTDGAGSVAGAFSWMAPATKPSAGTAQYEVTFTPTDTNYNTAKVNVSVTVAKATPTLTAPTASAIQYGQKLSDSTLTGGTATNPNGNAAVAGSWSWASGNTRPTATGTFPVAFVPGDTANYNTPGNVDASVTVNPAAPKITLTVPPYQIAGGEVKVTYQVENPHDAAFKEGIPETVTLTYKVGDGAEQTLTGTSFNIPEGTAKDTVITVTASTATVDGKYTAATKTATVTVTDKIPVEISGVGVTGRAYNGKAIDHTGTPVIKTLDGEAVTDATVTYTWNTSDGTAPVNAGSYTLTISVGGEKYIGSTTVDFTIEKATVTITAANKSAVVGSVQPELTYTVSGLADGETLATVPTLTCTPDMNTVGSYPITASGAAVPNASNYNTEITYVAGTLSVTAKPSTGGGGYVPSGPGSSTITVPVSGDKSTVHVSASVSGTTATVSKIDTSQIENVIGDNGQASMVEIDFTGLGKTIDTVNLPAAAIKDIAAKAQNEEVGGLTVKLPEAEISFDANALSAIQAQAGSQITLTVTPAKPIDLNNRQKEAVGSAPVFDLTLRSSSGAITDFRGGYATVSLPYTLAAGQNPSGVVVYYLDSTGNITPCTTMYDVRSKSAIFTTGHLSLYFVGYDPTAVWVNPFSDVAEGAWYYDAVRFVSENGLMGGYGNGRFGPNDTLTRAQFAQILFNKEGRPVVNYLLQYGDVATGAWYTEAVRWATSQGIVGGYGNGMFGPNDNITREQLAVMLWRYAGSPAATDKELHFTDTDKASGFALEALRWAVENGVMGGYGDGRLDPKGLATRAQVAQMLKNYLEK